MVEKYRNFAASFSKSDSWDWWADNANRPELMIYQVNEITKKMSGRAFDDTPSIAVYESLRYVDFGGDSESKDPVSRIMEVTGLGFLAAVEMFLGWSGQEVVAERVKWERKKETKSEAQPYKPSYLRNVILNRNKFKNQYINLRKELFRGCSDSEIRYAENVLHVGYIPQDGEWCERIFLPEMDIKGVAYGSYRYNRAEGRKLNGNKGLIRKNSKRVLYGEHMIPKFKNSVIYAEGHSDCVVNISKRYSCITTGSSTKKIGMNLEKLKGLTLYDFPDLDLPGMKGAMSRFFEIEEFNLTANLEDKINHVIFWWADWIRSSDIFDKLIQDKVAKTDMFFSIKNRIPVKKNYAFLNLDLLSDIQKEICKKKKWDHSKIDIKKWHIIFKGTSKPDGFDFADFYTEESSIESKKLLSFFNTSVKY